ncbi:orotidine-5'-phosphate decarboxylase [Homoserinimonas aerilata]|uniref:Orotidine-5'-phosphate decarboxylase n=1 Tax=Homoserinimonas aerilata TaxID=1162970 RepID=A0A542YIR4_9MICO|nr:orotidine-5'-phosphate decarboxylase [Homoserinimonas aerilata]TQL47977.1 orotidine-5'-phosphate decarboxylase [Homoserinimonas aerilata]
MAEPVLSFGERLDAVFSSRGRLCVGIDPHPYLLEQWRLPDSASGLRQFGLRVVEASVGHAGIVKPQVAFFERHGSAGYSALEEVIAAARSAGILVIADAKRGDVGTSVEAYGQSWLRPGSPLEADALTVSAFQGFGSLDQVVELAVENGKGLFILAATSNPEAAGIQQAVTAAGSSVAESIASDAAEWNALNSPSAARLGSLGLVLGATVQLGAYGITSDSLVRTPILAPGFGHQGAQIADFRRIFGAASSSVVIAASRSILSAGPDGVAAAVARQQEEAAAAPADAS